MSARRLGLPIVAAAWLLCACAKDQPVEPDHPIQRAELVITTTPPIPATVPAVVKPGEATQPIALTSGIAVSITITVFQDGKATAATMQTTDTSIARRYGNIMYGDKVGSTTLVITAPKAAAALEIPVTVKDQ